MWATDVYAIDQNRYAVIMISHSDISICISFDANLYLIISILLLTLWKFPLKPFVFTKFQPFTAVVQFLLNLICMYHGNPPSHKIISFSMEGIW